MGKQKKQHELIQNLKEEFFKVQARYRIPSGDFQNVDKFRNILYTQDIGKFARLKPRLIQQVDDMLAYDIPKLLQECEVGSSSLGSKEMKSDSMSVDKI